jgi:hypothetical protein
MQMIYDVVKDDDVYKICSIIKGPNGPISTIMPYKFAEHYDAMTFIYKYCTCKGVPLLAEELTHDASCNYPTDRQGQL